MNNAGKLSVVITAYNEEKKIKACLESVKWANEIIFVDNSSTDHTLETAEKYTKKIYSQKNDPTQIDLQKNFGIEKATGDWILVLDGDEKVSSELKSEIISLLNNDTDELSGFWIPRKNIIFGKWIQNTGWYPDYQVRLFRKGKGKYIGSRIHEALKVNGKVGKLTQDIYHHNYESISQFIQKMDVYTSIEADILIKEGKEFNITDLFRNPFDEFLSRFFARGGYKDGLHGLVLASLQAISMFVVALKLWEKKGFVEVDAKTLFKETEKEAKKMRKDILYWFTYEKINKIKNPIKKNAYKFLRKFAR